MDSTGLIEEAVLFGNNLASGQFIIKERSIEVLEVLWLIFFVLKAFPVFPLVTPRA